MTTDYNFKVLCFMTSLRGGSKLFHSLLDSHPQIICFPRTLQFNKFWESVSHRKEDLEFIINSFIEQHPRFFSGESWYRFNKYDRADQLGPSMNETFSVDINVFREKALEQIQDKEITRRLLFIGLHVAYHLACGREIKENSMILNHIHGLDLVEELEACLSDFPDAKLLVMYRHPVEGLKSVFKWMKMQNILSMPLLFAHYKVEALVFIESIMERFPDIDIKILSFELLHMQHRNVMMSFAQWVDISWDDSLMESTLHGKLWWGNGKSPRNGTNPEWKIYQPSDFLERNDHNVFCGLKPERMKVCGYMNAFASVDNVQNYKLYYRILLPTETEWLVLKSFFSKTYWKQAISEDIKEIRDTRFAEFDFLTKTAVRPGGRINKWIRLIVMIIRHMKHVNPVVWLYYYFKRIHMCFSHKKQNRFLYSERMVFKA